MYTFQATRGGSDVRASFYVCITPWLTPLRSAASQIIPSDFELGFTSIDFDCHSFFDLVYCLLLTVYRFMVYGLVNNLTSLSLSWIWERCVAISGCRCVS